MIWNKERVSWGTQHRQRILSNLCFKDLLTTSFTERGRSFSPSSSLEILSFFFREKGGRVEVQGVIEHDAHRGQALTMLGLLDAHFFKNYWLRIVQFWLYYMGFPGKARTVRTGYLASQNHCLSGGLVCSHSWIFHSIRQWINLQKIDQNQKPLQGISFFELFLL